jgi:VIT1/CCC1 family predicted Fe2+/Mn2+ transporter
VAGSSQTGRTLLDPVVRASEVLFGLIMVLTFTTTFGAATAERGDVRLMIAGALGCNIAWGIIDAIFHLMGTLGDRALGRRTIEAVKAERDPHAAHGVIADTLPDVVRGVLDAQDYERIRQKLAATHPPSLDLSLGRDDWLAALGVFLHVFLATLPVVLPFIFITDAALALRISNAIAIGLLFLTGYAFGRQSGRPFLVGVSMVLIGVALVATANALGG